MLETETAELALEVLLLAELLHHPRIAPAADSHCALRTPIRIWSFGSVTGI
jgi:hypothetical protein